MKNASKVKLTFLLASFLLFSNLNAQVERAVEDLNIVSAQETAPTDPVCTAISGDFTYSIRLIRENGQIRKAPLVQFGLESAGRVQQIEWEFGDGGIAFGPAPQHKYRRPGIYPVCVRLEGPCGVITICKVIYISIDRHDNAQE